MKRFVITSIAAAAASVFSVSAQTPSTGPANAAPGECYAKVVVPARFETQACDRMFEDIASAAASTEYQAEDLADSTQILHCRSSLAFLPRHCGSQMRGKQAEAWILED